MNEKLRIFMILMTIAIIIYGVWYMLRPMSSTPTPTNTGSPSNPTQTDTGSPNPTPTNINSPFAVELPTTKYRLTEQAILLNYTAPSGIPYETEASQTIFNKLFTSQQLPDVLKLMKRDGKTSVPPTLQCYTLYTDVFNYGYPGTDLYEYDYDIIGAYFFLTLSGIPNIPSSPVTYYDYSKLLLIQKDVLKKAMAYWNLINPSGNAYDDYMGPRFLFSGGEMPMLLDEFVPRISRYLLANYAKRNSLDWNNKKKNCV